MKKSTRFFAVFLAALMVFAIIPVGNLTASALTLSEYNNKYTSFINDSRWRAGVSWGYSQTPKLSSWGSKGCCAYAADFEYYMYGSEGWAGTAFYSADEISIGCILYIKTPNGGEHWIVVLERNGNTLYTAEGNFGDCVHITDSFYRVYNGYLQQKGYYNSSNEWISSWTNCTLVKGYKYPITTHTHSYGAWQTVTNATCTAAGSRKRVCSCGDTQTETIAALGHAWNAGVVVTNAGCTADGLKQYTCTRCNQTRNEALSATGHTPVTDIEVPVTCTQSGLTQGSHCSVCNAIITAQEIVPALGHDNQIQTIDRGCDTVTVTYQCSRCNHQSQETSEYISGYSRCLSI